MSTPAVMSTLFMTNTNASIQTSFVGVPTIGTFSNGPTGPLGVTIPTNIFAHLNLPVYDSVALWLDAADFATIGLSATRGAGGYSQVSAWYDKSSNAQHLTQVTTANQPYYHPSGFNGRPGIRFGYNSGITSLARTGNFMVGNSEMTCFLVYRNEGRVGDASRFVQAPGNITTADGSAAYDGFSIKLATGIEHTRIGGTADSRFLWAGTVATMLNNSSSNSIGGLSANTFGIWQNGSLGASNVGNSFIRSNYNCRNLTIGAAGFSPAPPTPIGLVGYICEFIVYTRALNVTERQAMESYLTQKWAITSNTPIPLVNNLALWLDAADTDMLTTVSQTTNATPYISAWFDKSGNYQHMRQATAARQPFYTSNSFNGRPAIRFGYSTTPESYVGTQMSTSGIDFISSNASANATTNLTAFLVVKNEGLRRTILHATDRTGVGNHMRMEAGINPTSGAIGGFIATRPTVNATLTGNSFQREGLYTVLVNPSQTASNGGITSNAVGLFYNGILQSTSTDTNIGSNFSHSNLTLGVSGTGFPAGGAYTGYMAEIIVYNATLSLTQRLSIETYLTSKWGLSSNIFPTPFTVSARLNNTVPGPCAWFDASDRESVLLGTGPNAQNNYVQFWYDKSGRAYPMNQATSGSRPYYDPIGFNGLPTIKFGYTGATSLAFYNNGPAGSSNFLNSDFMSNDISMFCAMKIEMDIASIGNNNRSIFSARGAISADDYSGDGFNSLYNQSNLVIDYTKFNPGNFIYDIGSNMIFSLVANTGTSNLVGGVTASNYIYYINGTSVGTGAINPTFGYSNISTLTLTMGQYFGGGQVGRFSLSEFLIYNRGLNGTEKSNIESYLRTKWNMSNTAANAAPYQAGTTSQPLYLSLAAWYDASEAATIGLLNTTCNYVTNWYDKTGRGFTLNQGTAINSPYYNPRGFSSLPAIQFSGAGITSRPSVSLRNGNFTIFNTGACNALTYFLVCKYETSQINFGRLISFYAGSGNDNGAPSGNMRYAGGTSGFACEGVPNISLPSQPGSNVLYTLSINYTSNTIGQIPAFTSLGFVNGSLIPTASNTNSNRRYLSTTTLSLGTAFYDVGVIASIPECLIYISTLGTTDQRNIESYLMNKWSISTPTVTLPAPNTILSGLSMWLDADDYYLLRVSNTSVTSWLDKSTNGAASGFINNIKGTGQNFPLYFSTSWVTYSNVVKPTIRFDASLKTIISGQMDQSLMRNASLSLFQVGSIDAGSASAGRLMSFLDSNINFGTITNEFQPSNVGGLAIFGTNTGQISVNRSSANNNNLLTATVGCNIKFQMSLLINPTNATVGALSASNSQFIVNIPSGTGGTTQVFSNLGVFFATSTINISSFAIGGSAFNGVLNTTDLFSGYMSEIVAYNRVVSAAERQTIESYLRNKWF